jgi:hypothetical protein
MILYIPMLWDCEAWPTWWRDEAIQLIGCMHWDQRALCCLRTVIGGGLKLSWARKRCFVAQRIIQPSILFVRCDASSFSRSLPNRYVWFWSLEMFTQIVMILCVPCHTAVAARHQKSVLLPRINTMKTVKYIIDFGGGQDFEAEVCWKGKGSSLIDTSSTPPQHVRLFTSGAHAQTL